MTVQADSLAGSPVLLIMGLGLSGGAWWRTVPVLSRRFRVISFDNRGVGRSRSLTYSYTTEAMADDAASVLDACGVDHAHVYGISLGGMVAQQLALRHPRRVRSLVLGATHPCGPRAVAPDREAVEFFARRLLVPGGSDLADSRVSRSLLYEGLAFGESPRWHDGRVWLSDINPPRALRPASRVHSTEVARELDPTSLAPIID